MLDGDAFRARVSEALDAHLPSGFHSEEIAARFLARLHNVPLDPNDVAGFTSLAQAVGDQASKVAIFLSPGRRSDDAE